MNEEKSGKIGNLVSESETIGRREALANRSSEKEDPRREGTRRLARGRRDVLTIGTAPGT